jgi:hypothetical protein
MNSTIEIPTNPFNPVNYLACCGLFDLIARMDKDALGWWNSEKPVRFCLQTRFSEPDLLRSLLSSLRTLERWNFFPNKENPTAIFVSFASPDGKEIEVPLDWWLETADLDGTIMDKSAWKMYAGQQTVTGITTDMVAMAAELVGTLTEMSSIVALLEIKTAMTGRFGFDPRASRNALDVGYSPNDLHMPVETYVFAEQMAMFGVNSFFPARCSQPGSLSSTRGWTGRDDSSDETGPYKKGFSFRLWSSKIPIALARVHAVTSRPAVFHPLFSARATRKNYSNLTLA